MKILSKITDNGVIVGYRVEDDAFVLPLCKKALYLDMYIEPLINAGYKYYGYDADTIEDPNGVPITMLPEVLLSEQDDMEWFASVNMADSSALTDVEASRYYTFRESSVMKFKTEDSYEINTREELVAYLRQLERTLFSACFSTDCRPINSFVNPDALFTIEELSNDPEIRQYFAIMMKRHHMRNYGAYMELVNWMFEKGVLKNKMPSIAEFLAGYYAWGPEGIKDKCTNYELKMNVDGIFTFVRDPLQSTDGMSYVIANRDAKSVAIDGTDTLHFLKHHQDISQISDVKDFGRSRIAVGSNDTLMTIRRRQQSGKKYMAIGQTLVSDVSDRVYFTLVTESGFSYTYKVSHNKLKIGLTHTNTSSEVFSTYDNFGIASITPSVTIPLNAVDSEDDYYLWNLAILKSAQIINSRSKRAPFKSTTEYLIADGVNPVATVDMMANAIVKNGNHQVNKKYQINTKDDDLLDALELYMKDIPEYILRAYCISQEDITDGMQSFLELADLDDLKDRREDMLAMRIGPNDPGFDPTYADYESKVGKKDAQMAMAAAILGIGEKKIDAVDYYTKIKFVDDCIHGCLSVNNFGDGITEDMGAAYDVAAECILSVIYAEFGDTPDRKQAENAILNIENSDLIDVNKLFRVRDNAWKGYMVDFAEYRSMRANSNAWVWAYCTKVFREISNAPIEKQRPYLMELVILENNKQDNPTRELMTACVKGAIEKADFSDKRFDVDGLMSNWNEKKVAMSSADFIAAKLFFFIYAGGVKSEPIDGNYIVKMDLQEGMPLEIPIPVQVYEFVKRFNVDAHRRYITVYDYCKYEYNPNTKSGTFNICLVNADVDPWHVRPKKGYSIKSFSLLPNYYGQSDLDAANGAGFYVQAYNAGGIAVSALKDSYRSLFIPYSTPEETVMYEGISKAAKTYVDMEEFLYPDQYEYVFAYVKRWALAKKHAAEQGMSLYSIPLKQDIVYSEFAYIYCEEVPTQECVYVPSAGFDGRAAQKDTSIKIISWRDFESGIGLISVSSTKVHQFSIKDVDMTDIEVMEPIISGRLQCTIPIVVSGNYLVIKDAGVFRVPVSKITAAQTQQFISDGVLYPIAENKYFIRAINGDYVLEV